MEIQVEDIKQKIYCEIEFYKQFVNSFPKSVYPNDQSITKTKCWIELYSYFSKNKMFFDISEKELIELSEQNEYFKFLIKQWGENKIETYKLNFPDLEKFEDCISINQDSLESVYLSCKSDELCKKVEDSFGIKVISIDKIFDESNFFNVHIETVEKGDKSHTNWDFLHIFSHPCNSLAIVDNYILKDTNVIDENLIPVLDKVLPSNLKIPFHLSVFAKNDFHNKERYELIKETLDKLRPNLSFRISVFQLRSEFHDRTLITNYLILDSGSGFDLFSNKKAKHQTKITGYYPFSASNINFNARFSYQVLRKSMKEVYDKGVSNEKFQDVWGEKENRLFEN